MSEFKKALKPYNLEVALAEDRGKDCLVVDIGRDEDGQSVTSLQQIIKQDHRHDHHAYTPHFAATKLYIIGDWNLTPLTMEDVISSDVNKNEKRSDGLAKWNEATETIKILLEQMGNLEELTWVSGLPFTAAVWEKLPTTLTKLVLDLGEPVRLDQDGEFLHKSYITLSEMKPLLEQVKLKELRLFRVRDSLQPLVWETVFRNISDSGMRVLDLQMAAAPIVRSEQWKKANDVAGLTVPTEECEEKQYKGMDGKGILHYSIGTGEYLDGFCIRKARIASGLDEATPLPLWCLKLDGMVIDHLPFEHELSRVVLLTCGENCIDSGLRAPKTSKAYNNWSKAVNNATSHCLIQWPNWTGIFDDHGDQRNKLGVVIPYDMALSTPLDDFSPSIPLTEKSLNLKALDDALEGVTDTDYFTTSPPGPNPSVTQVHLAATSISSTSRSEVPTPTCASSTCSPPIPALTASSSFAESDMVMVNGPGDSMSPTSILGSFEHVSPPASDEFCNVGTGAWDTLAVEENSILKKSTFTHKVRRSWDWLSGRPC